MDGLLRYLKASDFLSELKGYITLVKSDFNVPISDGLVADDFRITQASGFIKKLIENEIVPLLATHLGRPKGYDPSQTLDIIVDPLTKALGAPVQIIRFDPERKTYSGLNKDLIYGLFNSGKISLLDNIRFHPDETKNKGGLAKILANVADVSIQNSFGTAHRKEDTSNYIHEYLPGLAGDLLVQEIEAHYAIKKPNSPYIVIVGGDKVSDSLQLMRALFRAETTTHWSNLTDPSLNLSIGENLVDYILVGGHLMNAFVYAQVQMIDKPLLDRIHPQLRKEFRSVIDLRLAGYDIDDEEKKEEIRLAKGLLRLYNNYQLLDQNPLNGRRLVIPQDYTVIRENKMIDSVRLSELLDEDTIIDIGIKTQDLYTQVVKSAKTIVWNGPLGINDERYVKGTRRLIDAIDTNTEAVKGIGGGSTNYVISAYEREKGETLSVGFRSTGGGSTLLEVAYDSPVIISLMMSASRLILGHDSRYGPKYEALRSAAIEKLVR